MKLRLITLSVVMAFSSASVMAAHTDHSHTEKATQVQQRIISDKLITVQGDKVTVNGELAKLNKGDIFSIDLGKAGAYNMTFEHKTAQVDGVQYLEAILLGDTKQRLSLKNDKGVWTGAFVTNKLAMTIGQVNGQSILTNVGKSYANAGAVATRASSTIMEPLTVARNEYDSYRFNGDKDLVNYPMDIKLSQLSEMKLNSEHVIKLPDGQEMTFIYDTKDTMKDGGTVWSGYSKETGISNRATLVYGAAGVYGHISTADGGYDVESKDGKTWVTDIKASKLKHTFDGVDVIASNDGNLRNIVAQATAVKNTTTATTTTTGTTTVPKTRIDVLYTYDQAFFDKYKATTVGTYPESGPELKIKSYIAIANQAYIDSGIDMTLNSVGFMRYATGFTLQKKPQTALNEAINGAVNIVTIDEAVMNTKGGTSAASTNVWRNRLNADIVVSFTPYVKAVHTNICGLAYLGGQSGQGVKGVANAGAYAYAFVAEGSDATSGTRCLENVMPHEVGHLMGAHHDRKTVGTANLSQAAFPYAFGYRIPNGGGTIMAYAYPRYNVFSTPLVNKCSKSGAVCGVANSEDNARVLNSTKEVVSQYRIGYDDPSVKLSGTFSYYGAPIPGVRSLASGMPCADSAYNGYFSCNVGLNSSSSWSMNSASIVVPTTSKVVTGNTTVSTSYFLTPITGVTYQAYTGITQDKANAMNFSVNFGLQKNTTTCVNTGTSESCSRVSVWATDPITTTSSIGVKTVVSAGTAVPVASPAVKTVRTPVSVASTAVK